MTDIVERHSPLPWVAEPDDRDGYQWNIHIVEACCPSNRVCFMTSNGLSEANADYIVTACNAYPGLMQEIERLRTMRAETAKAAAKVVRAATIEECANLMQVISLSLLMRPAMEEAIRAKTYIIDAIRALAKEHGT